MGIFISAKGRRIIGTCVFLFLFQTMWAGAKVPATQRGISRGVWVTVFSDKKVIYSKKAALELVDFCEREKIDEIYLQVYRAGDAFYDSKIAGRANYEIMLDKAGEDMIDYLLAESEPRGIKVFAWINVLSLSKNRNAAVLNRHGDEVLTKDQFGRTSIRTERVNESDKYYLRDDQLFMEPGDDRVADYAVSVVQEIITRYPGFSGVHLDYIRYPHPVPFIPDTRFIKYGISYGYGEESVKRFIQKTGLDPVKLSGEGLSSQVWDDWKRENVTRLVDRIARTVRLMDPAKLISCAVMASPERAYLAAYQDWPLWLEKNIIDYVVTMNYTKDERYLIQSARASSAQRGEGKVLVGLGAFLLKDSPGLLDEQCRAVEAIEPDGIVFFSYDDISK